MAKIWNPPSENFSVEVALYQVKLVDLSVAKILITGCKTLHVVNWLIYQQPNGVVEKHVTVPKEFSPCQVLGGIGGISPPPPKQGIE